MLLATLPLELLQQIASYVEAMHQQSLFAFSLSSKACHLASSFLIFRNINLTVRNPEGLRDSVYSHLETLSLADSERHVQCISLKGDIRPPTTRMNIFGQNLHRLEQYDDGLDEILGEEERMPYSGNHIVYDEPVIESRSIEDMAWAPVASLLQRIPCLQDLIYDCDSQCPPSLLSTLHEQHPQCRLHHLTFRFRTLLWGIPYPYEMQLATYPSLHKIKLGCSQRDSDGDDDFNLETTMELVAGLAPNLKEVTVLALFPWHSNRYYRRARDSWQGLPGYTGTMKGSLTSLRLKGYTRLESPALLHMWAMHTDFAYLQHLELGGCRSTRSCGVTSETMEWVAQNQSFPQMKTLTVYMNRDDVFLQRPQYSSSAVSFFGAFPPLEELAIYGPIDARIFDAVLCHHGQKLRKLALSPSETNDNISNARERQVTPLELTKDLVLQIQAQCTELEELAVPVKRDRSSVSEAEIYRSFATMRNLKYLFLNLDCSNWRVFRDDAYNPQFNGEDNEPVTYSTQYHEDQEPTMHAGPIKKGELKRTFINAAVDETLARSIWKLVSQHKTGKRLERLKLWTTGGGEYGGQSGLSYAHIFLRDLSRSWLIERDSQGDAANPIVRDLSKHEREDFGGTHYRDSNEARVFHSIWPPQKSSRDWRHDWSSVMFPEE